MDKWLDNPNFVRVVALILAILLWALVHLDQSTSTPNQHINRPITEQRMINDIQIIPIGLDEDMYYLRSLEPEYVNIIVRGYARDINQISPRDGQSRIVVDLSGLDAGVHEEVPLRSTGFPNGVTVDIYPANVKVVIDEVQQKEVPVEIHVQGQPAEGFRVGEPIVQPGRVFVSMPSKELEEVVAVRTDIHIDGASDAVVEERKVNAINAAGEIIADAIINPSVVRVEVPITSPFTTVPLQVRVNGEPAPGYSVASFVQDPAEVTLFGSEEVLSSFEFYGSVDVNIDGLDRSQTISVPIPLDQRLRRVHPEEVNVQVEIVPSETRLLEDVPILFNGQNEEAQTEFVEPADGQIDILLEGAPARLEQIQMSSVQAIVDVSNLPPGVYNLPVRLNLPPFIRYAGERLLTVRVSIQQNSEDNIDTEDELEVDVPPQPSQPNADDEEAEDDDSSETSDSPPQSSGDEEETEDETAAFRSIPFRI